MSKFVSLHCRTHYSILNSLVSPKELFNRAKELGQTAIAVSDYSTLSGAWDSWKAAKETGVKLIMGCEYYFVDDVENKTDKLRYIVLLSKNAIGYKNLLLLNRKGFDHSSLLGKKVVPIIDWKMIKEYSEGIICLTGCGNGIVGQLINQKRFEDAEETIQKLIEIYKDNLGIEVQTHNLARNAVSYLESVNQIFTNSNLIRLAKKYNVKVVPTNNVSYLKKEDAEIHDTYMAIGAMQPVYSNARIKYDISDLYLKTYEETKAFFARNYGEDFAEEICANTVHFANMCEQPEYIEPKKAVKDILFPVFDVKSESDYNEFLEWQQKQIKHKEEAEDASYLRFKCLKELEKKNYGDKKSIYLERLEEELDVLAHQKFSSYMLIVGDFIQWAENNNIPTGWGRGSCGGSLVGYLLNIHKADPIKYNLLFVRFQNKEKTSPPDIDTDFATDGRHKVIEYIQKKYGNNNVALVTNFSRITPKVFARDISRSCDIGNDRNKSVEIGNLIAGAIPTELKDVTNFDEIEKSPLFAEYCNHYPSLRKNKKILGKFRNYSTHAGACVISKYSLVGLVPLRKDKENFVSIEYEKNTTEDNGLLKVDILGLSTLDLIRDIIKLINKNGKILNNDYINYDLYDKKTYDLISSGNTYGVFQLGKSGGTIDLCKKIQPKSINDLAIITALARPAAKNIRQEFIDTKEGKRKFKLLHPSLNGAFKDTFGFGLFDESILQLVQDVAGWSLNSADRIRKMIKDKGKYPEKEEKLRLEFIEGAIKNGIDPEMSKRIWDEEISKFKGYTFNRSHAVFYSFTSFTTAYLKAHYPLEFLLANLMAQVSSNAPDRDDNIRKIKQEIRAMNIKILPPDINRSEMTYSIVDENTLLTGLDALKFVGDEAIEDIIKLRPFTSFDDFMIKTNGSRVRSNTIQALAATGSLDIFKISRKLIYLYCSDYKKKLQVWLKKHDPKTEKFEYPWAIEKEWSMPELYALEKNYLGEAFICTKVNAYPNFFNKKSYLVEDIKQMNNKDRISSMRCEIKNIFEFRIKKEGSKLLGQSMMKAMIEDAQGKQISMTIFPDGLKALKSRIKETAGNKIKFDEGLVIHFAGTANMYEDEMGIIFENLFEISPPPALPKDLKAKKISMRKKSDKEEKPSDIDDTDKTIEMFEDELFTDGFIDLNDENSEDDEDF